MSKSKRPLAVKPIDRVDWTCVRVQRVEHQPSTQIFAQGDPAASVMYVETGGVRLSVHRADAPMVQTIMFITERLMARNRGTNLGDTDDG